MAYEFQRLDQVTEVEEVSDGATVLIEEDGEIKRAPKELVGGGGSKFDTVLTIDGYGTDGQSIDVEGLTWEQCVEKLQSNGGVFIAARYIYGEFEEVCPCQYARIEGDYLAVGFNWSYTYVAGAWSSDNTWYFG